MMILPISKIGRVLATGLLLTLAACGSEGRGGDAERARLSTNANCAVENDCDEDGVFSTCDADDNNPVVVEVLAECDDDQDGFSDTPCTAFEDVDGDDSFGEAEREEYGVNCDVCPGMTDPEQQDSDFDGVGDLCALEPSIDINAAPPTEAIEAAPSDSGETGVESGTVSIAPIL